MTGMPTRGRGQPTKLDQVARHRGDGTPITVGEQIIERVQLGLAYQSAADSAGVARMSLHRWRLEGARHRANVAAGRLRKPTPAQQRLIDFCDALERAESEAEASRLAIIQRSASGGAVVTKVTVKVDGNGLEVERSTTTETLRPEWTAAAWFLERRYPARYARRVEVTGADGSPLVPQAEQARSLADELRSFIEGAAAAEQLATERKAARGARKAAAIDATATESEVKP